MAAIGAMTNQGIVSQEDTLRAQLYVLLARFLAKPPENEAIDAAASMSGDDSDLGQAIGALSKIAAKSNHAQINQEFHDLFIGVGRGELLPYASYYLTGFLHETPLAKLRDDMGRLNIERRETVSEPEDHVAAIMEMMAGLITGQFGEPASLDEQKAFYDAHLGSWGEHFFADLEAAKASVFYAAIGSVGKTYLEIEKAAFAMD